LIGEAQTVESYVGHAESAQFFVGNVARLAVTLDGQQVIAIDGDACRFFAFSLGR